MTKDVVMRVKQERKDIYEQQLKLAEQSHPSFTITCKACGSEAVIVHSDVGFSAQSGAWGEVSLVCQSCGKGDEIWKPW